MKYLLIILFLSPLLIKGQTAPLDTLRQCDPTKWRRMPSMEYISRDTCHHYYTNYIDTGASTTFGHGPQKQCVYCKKIVTEYSPADIRKYEGLKVDIIKKKKTPRM